MLIYLYACAPIYVIYIWENTWISIITEMIFERKGHFSFVLFYIFSKVFVIYIPIYSKLQFGDFPFVHFLDFQGFLGEGWKENT